MYAALLQVSTKCLALLQVSTKFLGALPSASVFSQSSVLCGLFSPMGCGRWAGCSYRCVFVCVCV